MIRPGAIVMTVLMSAVAVGVYFGLDYLPQDMIPGMKKQGDGAATTQPMAGKPLVADSGTAAATSTVDRMASGVESPVSPAPVTEDDLADEPQPATTPAAPPATATPSLSGAVDADPDPTGVAVPVDETLPTETASEPAAVAAAEPPAPKPKAERAPAKIARAPSPSAADPAREPVKPKAPEADSIKPWWPDPATMEKNQLKLQYAGQVQNELAIALLFSSPLNLETLKQNAKVQDATGYPLVAVEWELAKNPRMAILRGIKPGRYTIILAPAIADAQGYLLGTTLQGPVYIQAQ